VTTFAERLRMLRRAAGLSQTELAGDGLSPSYISLLESGRRSPSPAVAALLAARLGCSTSQLLQGEPSEHERRVQLELAYAELALRHGGATDAMTRLSGLLDEPDLPTAEAVEAQLLLARAQEHAGDLGAAIATLSPLLDRARAGDRAVSLPRVAVHLCFCHSQAGDLTRTVAVGEQALEACRAQGLERTDDYFMLASTVMLAYADLGDEAHASAWAQQLIAEAEAVGSLGGQAALYWNASLLAEREGHLDDALHLSRRALARLGELGDSRDLARLKLASAEVLLAADPPRTSEAGQALEQAQGDLRRLGSELDVVTFEQLRSAVSLFEGDPARAEALAREATRRLPEQAGSEELSKAHRALGDAFAAQGVREQALEQWGLAGELHAASSNPGRGTALTWRDLAERFRSAGESDSAIRAYRAALDAAGVRDRTSAVLAVIAELSSRTGAGVSSGREQSPDPASEHHDAGQAEG
jgi:transcriptional regulator with XRE-family HTH domain